MTPLSSRRARRRLLALLLLSAPALHAAVTGRVTDRSGDPVAGAQVRLDCAGQPPLLFAADTLGRFEALPPDSAGSSRCRLIAALPDGGAPGAPFPLAAGERGPLTLRLDLDLVVDRIEVQGAPTLDTVASREIRESFARDAGEAAARVPGVTLLRKGGLAADIVLRGARRDDVEVRVDGHRLYGACPNRMDPPAFHVDFAEIERIDVGKGPFDVARGGLAGVIDIVTREPEPGLHVEAQAAAGTASYFAPSLGVTYGGARWSAHGGASMRQGDPYSDGDGRSIVELAPAGSAAAYAPAVDGERAFDVATYWAGAGYSPRPGHRVSLEATRQEGGIQLYPYLQMDAESDDATRARAEYRFQATTGWLRSLAFGLSRATVEHDMTDRFRVSGQGKPLGWSMGTLAESEVFDQRLDLTLADGIEIGLDAYQREWRATTRMAGMAYRPQEALADATLDGYGLWARFDRPLGERLRLRAGARLDRAETGTDPGRSDTALYLAYHGTRTTERADSWLSGNVGLAWAPSESWELAAGLGSATRSPDPQERYFALRRMGTDWVGNPDLEPTSSVELDLGARYHAGAFAFDLDGFLARVDDAVTLVEVVRVEMVPGVINARARSYVNHDERRWGLEGSARWTAGERLLLTLSGAYVRGDRDLAPELGVGDRDLPEMPPLNARLALRYDPGRWFVEGETVAAARQSRVDSGLSETPTPGVVVGNLRGGFEQGPVSLYVGVDNLFDRAYRSHLSYQRDPFRSGTAVPEPGRTFTASLRFRR